MQMHPLAHFALSTPSSVQLSFGHDTPGVMRTC